MGGGILPVSLVNGKLMFLFGKEVGEKKWGILVAGRKVKKVILKQLYEKVAKN